MSALTADRNTLRRDGKQYSYPVAASTKIFAGSMVALNSSGYAVPAADTSGLRVVGRAAAQADNSSGAAAAINVEVEEGVFLFTASGATIADVGKVALVTDDQTLSLVDTTNDIVAGVVVDFKSSTELWVYIGPSKIGKVTKLGLSYKSVAVTVALGAASGASAADADLEDGAIVGYYPTGNQDQHVDNVALGADGAVTITLAANATADNTFNVVVLRATA